MIYGTAVLAICTLAGLMLGETLGTLIGIKANVGGVGIAMLLLVFVQIICKNRGWDKPLLPSTQFWGGMYIPVVVAMAMQLDVHKALGAGMVALLSALLTVMACGALIAWINRAEPDTAPVNLDAPSNPS